MAEDRCICGTVCDLIQLYVDGCISDESRSVVDDHISHCSSCGKALEKAEHAHKNIDKLYAKACKREQHLQSFRKSLPWIIAVMLLAAAAIYIFVMAPFGIGEHRPDKDDMNMINYLHEIEMPFIIVLTKKDKLKKTQQIKRLEELETELAGFEDVKKFPFSAVTGEGVEEIRAYIEKCVHKMTGAQE